MTKKVPVAAEIADIYIDNNHKHTHTLLCLLTISVNLIQASADCGRMLERSHNKSGTFLPLWPLASLLLSPLIIRIEFTSHFLTWIELISSGQRTASTQRPAVVSDSHPCALCLFFFPRSVNLPAQRNTSRFHDDQGLSCDALSSMPSGSVRSGGGSSPLLQSPLFTVGGPERGTSLGRGATLIFSFPCVCAPLIWVAVGFLSAQ